MAIKITPASPVSPLVGEADDFLRALLERAYEQGYKSGFNEAQRRILEAASATTLMGASITTARPVKENPTVHPNSGEARRFPYGAIANAFRSALLRSTAAGISTDDMLRAAAAELGIRAVDIKHRDKIGRAHV